MSEADQVKQGAAALADLFESDYERIARYIAVRIGNTGHAEELAGDVFVKALERIDTFKWRGVPMQAWLFRIAHNLVVDYLRKNSRRKSTSLDEALDIASSDSPENETLLNIQREEIVAAMEHLTPAQREVVTLRFFGELTSKEVADVVKRSHGAVRELQSSAMKTLRKMLSVQPAPSIEVEG